MGSHRQLSFSGGEVTPAVWGRVDQVKHATGLSLCKNFFVMRHGGLANRAGTTFVGEVKDSTKKTRLYPFVFSASQTYILEFGDLYMRVILNGVHVKDITKSITAITQANPCVVTAAAHGMSNGDEVYISGIGGMTELNVRNFKIANVTANTFSLQYMSGSAVDSTAFTAYTSGGTVERVYTLTTTYLEADLFELYFAQSADVVAIVHPSYPPRELNRLGHSSWTIADVVFGPTIGTPAGLASDASGTTYYYKVTAIDAETNEESLPTSAVGSSTRTSTLSWTAVSGASMYNVYVDVNGMYSWIATAGSNTFKDATYTPDPLDTPPTERLPFDGTDDYPSTVTFFQQRQIYANTNNNPETVFGSRSTLRKNFMISSPLQDDDAVTLSLVGKRVNSVRHLLGLGKLLALTDSGEWSIEGEASVGAITPFAHTPKPYTTNGANELPPLIVEGSALYVQARGSVVRDLNYDFQTDGYKGSELSIFSSHLFDSYTMVDWAYQQIPHSVVWLARSDGMVVGMTYIREHAMFGWHQHDFGGIVESVEVIPEGTEDFLYIVIKRTIDGTDVRYVERMATRLISEVEDCVFTDSTLSYDGRNTFATTMTLSSAGGWTYQDTITVTASTAFFDSSDVGNAIWVTDSAGDVVRVTITGYTSSTVVTGRPHKDVPTSLQATTVTTWSRAVDVVTGLWHLEGKSVSILADATVAANPNNADYTVVTVANGSVILDAPHAVIRVGLPVTAEMETLSLDSEQVVLTDKQKQIGKLTIQVQSSRGIFAGPSSTKLKEPKVRTDEDYDDPIALKTGVIEMNISAEWNAAGKVHIRQIDPLPLSVLAVVPAGYLPKEKKRTS